VVLASQVERALTVVAHPDDVDFWAGGTIASATVAAIRNRFPGAHDEVCHGRSGQS
jgi:hypothetical protein